jgi:predicted GIY-YIG superfamily endonuclease
MFFVYMLNCSDGSYYTGHTDNLEYRVLQHQQGEDRTCYTFARRPVTCVYSETFSTRLEALEMERRIKGWGRNKKEALIKGDWELLKSLAKNKTPKPNST